MPSSLFEKGTGRIVKLQQKKREKEDGLPAGGAVAAPMSALDVRNGRVDIEVPTDEDAKHCARVLKDQHSSLKSIDLRRGLVTSAGAGVLAKALKGG